MRREKWGEEKERKTERRRLEEEKRREVKKHDSDVFVEYYCLSLFWFCFCCFLTVFLVFYFFNIFSKKKNPFEYVAVWTMCCLFCLYLSSLSVAVRGLGMAEHVATILFLREGKKKDKNNLYKK